MTKTNAIRILETRGVPFKAAEYAYAEKTPGGVSGALDAAGKLGVPPERVYKTLVAWDERKSGYVHGGCSPIGLKRPAPVFLDARAEGLDWLYINGGRRGLQVRIAPRDLAAAVQARFADLT